MVPDSWNGWWYNRGSGYFHWGDDRTTGRRVNSGSGGTHMPLPVPGVQADTPITLLDSRKLTRNAARLNTRFPLFPRKSSCRVAGPCAEKAQEKLDFQSFWRHSLARHMRQRTSLKSNTIPPRPNTKLEKT